MTTQKGRRRSRAPGGFSTWLRACDVVSVRVPSLGYVRIAKKVAAALVDEKGVDLSAEYVPELGLLLLDITAA